MMVALEQTFALAQQHHQAGRLAEAEALYREILRAQPRHAGSLHFLGVLAHQAGRNELAVELILRALRILPNDSAALANLGKTYRTMGRCGDAIQSYQRALQLAPEASQIHSNLGVALAEEGRFEEAIRAYRRALQLRPGYWEAEYNLGNALGKLGRCAEAAAAYRRAVEQKPDNALAWNELGVALFGLGRTDEAVEACHQAVRISPTEAEFYNSLGNALARQDQFDKAVEAYRRALELQPDHAGAESNLGNLHKALGQFDEALSAYRRAIAIKPDNADARVNLGLLFLQLGRYEEGWREHEWRLRAPAYAHLRRPFHVPQWDGLPVPGKSLLIHVEQGYGDALLLTRYLPLVCKRAQAARVILECQPALVPLLEQLGGRGIEVVARSAGDAHLPAFDFHLPLFSMPLVLESFAPFPPLHPPLEVDEELRTQWRERLGGKGKKRIGLAWAGNPQQEEDRFRSLSPERLVPLLEMPEMEFVSLQVEPRGPLPEVLVAGGVRDVSGEIESFADSAALMAELDLIITVDTATAHLAGTLSRPTWVFLGRVPYWPYGLQGAETPWYPTMRLFRQSAGRDWSEVVERIARALREWCGMIAN